MNNKKGRQSYPHGFLKSVWAKSYFIYFYSFSKNLKFGWAKYFDIKNPLNGWKIIGKSYFFSS
jgi:hypothetical protein